MKSKKVSEIINRLTNQIKRIFIKPFKQGNDIIVLLPIDKKILAILKDRQRYRKDQQMCCLDILDQFTLQFSKKIGFGTLFPSLNRLEKKGLIESKWNKQTNQSSETIDFVKGRRKMYKITKLGESISLGELTKY